MEYGFVKTAAVSPKIRVADPVYNGTEIIRLMKETWEKGARIIVFPELCIHLVMDLQTELTQDLCEQLLRCKSTIQV